MYRARELDILAVGTSTSLASPASPAMFISKIHCGNWGIVLRGRTEKARDDYGIYSSRFRPPPAPSGSGLDLDLDVRDG